MAKFVLYQDDDYYQFRWNLRDEAGKIVAEGPTGFMTYEECEKQIRYCKHVMAGAMIDDQTPPASRRKIPKRST
ncbi:hypothetical protein FBQ97_08040 [Acidobacteria bacterium ACD]|nr:MAG: hypothetical protein EDX89_16595 [Acidobacteriota bacterium]MCE7957943.1 hypothetical protein [Acidobacteria bacterium ACB2]MDL1949745.1 hypothetical protein [Acidobacteria bacterium ACD]